MSRKAEKTQHIVDALKILARAAALEGAANDPLRRGPESGRSEAVHPPLAADDRPTQIDAARLLNENQRFADHAEMLACALGACPNCWGRIADCEDCGGHGKPGAFNPDPACFAEFVLPVMQRLAAQGLFTITRPDGAAIHPLGHQSV